MVLNLFKNLASHKNDTHPASTSSGASRIKGAATRLPSTNKMAAGSLHPECGSSSGIRNRTTNPSSIPLLKMRQQQQQPMTGIRPPAANIIVEKGRIEFVKTPELTKLPTPDNRPSQAKLVMGTKIFRPLSPKKKIPESTGAGIHPPIVVRQRSASPKLREPSIAEQSRIPSAMRMKQPDVVRMRSSRETSPAPLHPPAPSPTPAKAIKSAVPVSPNLMRWRAKLSTNAIPANPALPSSAKKSTSPVSAATNVVQQSDEGGGGGGGGSLAADDPNQMQLLNLHYEVKRLEETVQTLLPLRHQQSTLIQSYEERLNEAQSRLTLAQAEIAELKERLALSEADSKAVRQTVQQLETERASVAAVHDQQRLVFDKCLDEIANHVVQALISQKNLQGECRRLRSQVSDLEQRNVALNLLLTQSLRDSMLESTNKKQQQQPDATSSSCPTGMTKSHSYDVHPAAGSNPRDSLCSTVSDSEIRLHSTASIFESGNGRPLVSKDTNWTLSSSSGSATPSPVVQQLEHPSAHNPVERAEKLLAVLKHRLFSAQLNNYKPQPHKHHPHDIQQRRSLVLPVQPESSSLPARPSTLSFPTASVQNGGGGGGGSGHSNDPSTPSVKALVQVLEQKQHNSGMTTIADKDKTSLLARPPGLPLPPSPGLMRIRNSAAMVVVATEAGSDSPASKDEGYSTMSSDVQVDSSSSSSSSFIASGCSSPATLRRGSASGSTPPSSITRSLPMAKRKSTLLTANAGGVDSSSPLTSRHLPNRSISLQETHSGAAAVGLEELKEEASDETSNDDGGSSHGDRVVGPSSGRSCNYILTTPPSVKREWPGIQLGTLCEDWSPSSAASDSDDGERGEQMPDEDDEESESDSPLTHSNEQDQQPTKWTSDSQLYKGEEPEGVADNVGVKTLQLNHRRRQRPEESGDSHPLRRSRARGQLTNQRIVSPTIPPAAVSASNYYSQHEMEDWILTDPSEPEDLIGSASGIRTASAAIDTTTDSEESEEEEEEEFFLAYSPECADVEEDCGKEAEGGEEEEEDEEESVDTEFTRDYYRLVKFESNRSLANSEKYDHCCPDQDPAQADLSVLPDRQVALQSVLDFIAEQQRYCATRESADGINNDPSTSAAGMESTSSSSLLQLRHLIPDDDDDDDDEARSGHNPHDRNDPDDGITTSWIKVDRDFQSEWIDFNNPEVRASVLDRLLRSSSSSSSDSSQSSDSFQDDQDNLDANQRVSHC